MNLESADGPVAIDSDTSSALQQRWATRDVPAELLKMHLWLLRYPKRRPQYLYRFIDNWLKRAPPVKAPPTLVVNAWWTTEERTLNQGAAVNCNPRPGESMQQFRERLGNHMKRQA